MFAQTCRLLARNAAGLAVLVALTVATPAAAQTPSGGDPIQAGSLAIAGVWARATPPRARTGAVYLTVTNQGREADRLIAAATPAATAAELHTHAMEGGVARMRHVEAVEIPPGQPVQFHPGGLHVMLVDLAAPLRDGQTIELTLTFEKAGTLRLAVPVRRTAPSGRPGTSSHRH